MRGQHAQPPELRGERRGPQVAAALQEYASVSFHGGTPCATAYQSTWACAATIVRYSAVRARSSALVDGAARTAAMMAARWSFAIRVPRSSRAQ